MSRRVKGLGAPSASAVGPAVPSGDAAPGPVMAGRSHESVGMAGDHAMAIPGMPGVQGTGRGTSPQGRNPNRVSARPASVPVSTPRGTNDGNHAEPTNPRMALPDGQGSGGAGEPDGAAGIPPGMSGTPLVNIAPMTGAAPNNPRGGVLNGYPVRMRRGVGSRS